MVYGGDYLIIAGKLYNKQKDGTYHLAPKAQLNVPKTPRPQKVLGD